MLRTKKSQSAIEFLITYGWAFLMVFGFIAALFYLDVIDVSKILPDKCEFSSEIECQEKIVISESYDGAGDGRMYFKLSNSLGTSIMIDGCQIMLPDYTEKDDFCLDDNGMCGTGDFDLLGTVWPQGESMLFNLSQCKTKGFGMAEGSKQQFYVTIQYHALGSSEDYVHNLTGRIYTFVEKPLS